MARILMILDKSFPPDLRVENEARSLSMAGHDVTVLAIGPDERDAVEDLDGIRIVRDRIPGSLRNKMRGLAGSVPMLTWYLSRRLGHLQREYRFDVFHAHDLYLFGAVLKAGRRLGVKVFGDMHENWVDALEHYHWSTTAPGKWFVNLKRWRRRENAWCLALDHLFVVIAEMATRLEAAGIPSNRIDIVPNTVRLEEFDRWPVEEVYTDARPKIVYTGGMDRHRGLEDAILAMTILKASRPEARLFLVGDGAVKRDLEALARDEGIDDRVVFEGWQQQERVKSYLAGADIALIPHRNIVQNDNGMPHKLFHYMRMGLPVVVSDCRPLKRIVEETGCGKVYTSGRPEELAARLSLLLDDAMLRTSLGANGAAAVARRYNWEATVFPLLEAYDSLP